MTSDEYKQVISALSVIFAIAEDICQESAQEITQAHQELFEAESRNDKCDKFNAQDYINRAISKHLFANEILTDTRNIRRNLLKIVNQEITF